MRNKILWAVIAAALLVFAYFAGHKTTDTETAKAYEAAMKNTLAAKEAEADQARRALEMENAAPAAAAPAAGEPGAAVGIVSSTPVYRGQACVRVGDRAQRQADAEADAEGANAEGVDDSAAGEDGAAAFLRKSCTNYTAVERGPLAFVKNDGFKIILPENKCGPGFYLFNGVKDPYKVKDTAGVQFEFNDYYGLPQQAPDEDQDAADEGTEADEAPDESQNAADEETAD